MALTPLISKAGFRCPCILLPFWSAGSGLEARGTGAGSLLGGIGDAVYRGAAQEGDPKDALERRDQLRQAVVQGDQAIGLDVNSIARKELVVRLRRTALGD